MVLKLLKNEEEACRICIFLVNGIGLVVSQVFLHMIDEY